MMNKTISKFLRSFLFLTGIPVLIQCNSGTEKTNHVSEERAAKDSCCANTEAKKGMVNSMQSEITCPQCGHKKMEFMPTDVCVIKYTCEKCSKELQPKDGDCCVFCTHGTHKCPSMQ